MTPPSPKAGLAFRGGGSSRPVLPAVCLGDVGGFGELAYVEGDRLFLLGGAPCPLDRVRALDRAGLVRWRFLEQRDWMRSLPAKPFAEAYERALERRLEGLAPWERLDEELRAHASKDASYLHGRMVEDGEAAPEERRDAEGSSADDRDLASEKE